MEAVLEDSGRCSFVPVMLAEEMSLRETVSIVREADRLKLPINDIVINKLYPDSHCPVCREEHYLQTCELRDLFLNTFLTLPSECVSLNRPGFEDLIHPRHRRGGGNVGIGFIDFQGLWEGRKTGPSLSGLPTNRHFHGLLRSPRTLRRRSSP